MSLQIMEGRVENKSNNSASDDGCEHDRNCAGDGQRLSLQTNEDKVNKESEDHPSDKEGKGKELNLQTMEGKVYNNERKDPVDDHEGSDDDGSCAGIEQRLSLLTMGDKAENESKDPEDANEGADDVSGSEVMSFLDLPWEDVVFPMILPCLPLQTLFQLRRVSCKGKDLIKEYFRISRDLNIARIAGRVTEATFKILTEDRCNLQTLNLRNAKDWLTDQLFIPLLKNNPRLQLLDLTNVTSLSNSSMHVLAVNCKDLRTLILRECHWLSAEGLTVIALNCRQLQSIDMTGCWNVNDEAITVLVMSCKKLKYISLAKIYGLTDIAMSVLARECTSLNHLNVQGCWRISDDSVRLLAEYTPKLQALQIRECRDVTEMVLSKLRDKKVKIDVRPPPNIHNMRMQILGGQLRQRLNIQI